MWVNPSTTSPDWALLRHGRATGFVAVGAAGVAALGGGNVDGGRLCGSAQRVESPLDPLLVGGLENVLFSHILGIIIPIDQYFAEGLKTPTSFGMLKYGING